MAFSHNHSNTPPPVNPPELGVSSDYYLILRPMWATAGRLIDSGELRGSCLLDALAIVSRKRAFWWGNAHAHFTHDWVGLVSA